MTWVTYSPPLENVVPTFPPKGTQLHQIIAPTKTKLYKNIQETYYTQLNNNKTIKPFIYTNVIFTDSSHQYLSYISFTKSTIALQSKSC